MAKREQDSHSWLDKQADPLCRAPRPYLIVVGASARAAAQSAQRAGYEPWCVDLFADRDLRAIAPVKRCPPHRYPCAILDLLEAAPDGPVLITGALENHLDLLEGITARRKLFGSGVEAIRAVREPMVLGTLSAARGLRFPQIQFECPRISWWCRWLGLIARGKRYVLKPRQGAGGVGITQWSVGDQVPPEHFLQQFIPGRSISAVFVGNGAGTRLIGVTRQIIGDKAFGVAGFRYCGNIGPIALATNQNRALVHLGVLLSERFGLCGIFGVDAIIDRRKNIWPVEVNPRYTASTELLERATGVTVLSTSPPKPREEAYMPRANVLHAKAIVFARQTTRVPDLYDRFDRTSIADVPAAGESIRTGEPICTLLASGTGYAACLGRLYEMARNLYRHLA